MDEPTFSTETIRALMRFRELKNDLPWISSFCASGGPLLDALEQFVRALGRKVKTEFALHGWQDRLKRHDDEGWVELRLFPTTWVLPEHGEIALSISWYNPFTSHAADRYVCVEVRAPRQWPHWNKIKGLIGPNLSEEGFTDRYDAEGLDPDSLFWKYIPFEEFISAAGFSMTRYVERIVQTVRSLLPVRTMIDEFLRGCTSGSHKPQEARDLRLVAFLDTETTGVDDSGKLRELAIINAACDPVTGDILGILEQYEFRGSSPNEKRVRDLLTRADWIVAHNASFDRRVLVRVFPWVDKLKGDCWKCSLTGIKWDPAVGTRLENLLVHFGLADTQQHHARADALDLLRLMSRQRGGKTLLAELLGW
jgi:hypothetical protein